MIILREYDQNQGIVLASAYPELAEQWNYDRNGALTPWDVTGGPATEKAVRSFQAKTALEPDGEIGADTWNALLTV